MEYKVVRHSESNDDYIEHAIFGLGSKKGGMQKGGQKENHLYLARQWIKNKWRYAYTQAQLKAMQNWGRGRGTTAYNAQMGKLRTQSMTAQRQANIAADKLQRSTKKAVNKAKSSASNAANKTLSSVSSLASNGKKAADHLSNVLSGNYAKKLDENTRRYNEYKEHQSGKAYQVSSSTKEDEAKRALEAFLARIDNNEKHAESNRNNEKAKQSADYKVSKAINDTKRAASNAVNSAREYASDKADKAKNVAEKALSDANKTLSSVSSLASNGKKAVDRLTNVLSGNYAKEVDARLNSAKEENAKAEKKASDAISKSFDAITREASIFKKGSAADTEKALATSGRYVDDLDKSRVKLAKAEAATKTNDYKLSQKVNDTKRAVSDAASKLKGSASSAVSSAQNKANAALKDAQALAADVRELAAENVRYYTNKDYRNLSNAADSLGRQLDSLDDSIAEASKYPEAATVVRTLRQQRQQIANQLDQAEQQLDSIRNKK